MNGAKCPRESSTRPLVATALVRPESVIIRDFVDWRSNNGQKKEKIKCPTAEEECREMFKSFGVDMVRGVRPEWLKYHTGNNLELDGFCEDMNLAFEFQGRQHYEFINHFHKSGREEFDQQVLRDKLKLKRCREKGVHLFVIPYTCFCGEWTSCRLEIEH